MCKRWIHLPLLTATTRTRSVAFAPVTLDTVKISTNDGPMPAAIAEPEVAARGAVIVIQEAFGVTSHIEEVAERLAGVGWLAVAPALYHRSGSPVFEYDDMERVRPAMGALTAEGIATDLDATVAYLGERGFAPLQCGIVGFCMGGSVTFFAACRFPLGAAVTYYGGGVGTGRFGMPSLIDQAAGLQTPWLGHFGDLDQGIPVTEVEQLRQALATATMPVALERYADADHGFNCNDRPAVYNADAAAMAWARTLAWFDRHIATG